jgi:phosphate transport system substrate-binding protein
MFNNRFRPSTSNRRTVKRRFIAPAVLGLAAVLAAPCWASLSSSAGQALSGSSSKAKPVIRLTEFVAPGAITLNGAGANSIAPFFTKVFYNYEQLHSKVTINYSPAGSSVGIKDIQENTVDFGDSEIPMSSSAQAAATGGAVLQVPVALGGVALSYNVPGAPNGLHLDGPTIAAIFDGAITKWNDPAIAKVSGVPNLPDLAIVPVHRADSSGPGWDLDQYLIKTSPKWVTKVGTSKASTSWPLPDIGEGEQLNTGVATFVKATAGAIGFVSYGYASKAGFTNAAVKNGSGSYVRPTSYTIGQAGAQATHLSATKFSIIDESGPSTYPLANFSWTLLYKKQASAAKSAALDNLFYYVVTTGQLQAKSLGYSALPSNVAQLAKATLSKLQS